MEQALQHLAAQNYSSPALETFINKHTMPTVLQYYLEEDNLGPYSKIQTAMHKIGQHPTLYKEFLFKTDKALLQALLSDPEPLIRASVSSAIAHNRLDIYDILSSIQDEDRDSFELYVDVLLGLLRDQDLSVAQPAQQALLSLATSEHTHQRVHLLKDTRIQEHLVNILSDQSRDNSEALLRTVDLVVDMANVSPSVLQVLHQSGALPLAVKQIETTDLLLKLGVVEVLAKLGDTPFSQQFVLQSPLLKVIREEAFSEQAEFYVQKYMVLLLCKMLSRSVLPLDSTLQDQLVQFLKERLQAQEKELLEGVLSILGVLFRSEKLLSFLAKQPIIIQLFMALSSTTDPSIKKKFLSALSSVFFQDEAEQQKDSGLLKNIYFCLGNPNNCLSYSPLNTLSDPHQLSTALLFKLLTLPFEDYETEALKVLTNLVRFEFGVKEVVGHKESVPYILKAYAKNKEIFDLKTDLRDHLERVTTQLAPKDAQVKAFREHYLKQKQQGQAKTNQVQTEAR